MTEKSAAFERVCEAAVAHFAVAGYDGGSLNEIAVMVGIKKASLYSHVASKDALYLQVLHDAAQQETEFAAHMMQKAPKARATAVQAGPGALYVHSIAKRYEESVALQFLLRAAFFPPAALKAEVAQAYQGFSHTLTQGFKAQLRQALPKATAAQMNALTSAYLGIVESLFAERLADETAHSSKRAKALWQVFVDALVAQGARL